MRPFRRSRSRGILLFFLAGCLFLIEISVAAPRPTATVLGRASVKRKDLRTTTSLASSSLLGDGDIVTTGANKATLQFDDGSRVDMDRNSSLEITVAGTGGKGLVRALKGRMLMRLRPGKTVTTRTALVRVRGTEIHLAVSDDGTTEIAVIEGEAEFANELGSVVVSTNQQSVARPGVGPTTPVSVANAGLIIEWTLDLNRAAVPREKFFLSLDPQVVSAALATRREAAQGNPEDANARRDYGDALFDSGHFAEALAEYEVAERLALGRPDIQVRIGDALLETNEIAAAEASYRAALTANKTPNAPALLGLAWVELKRNRPPEAQNFAEQAVAALPAGTTPDERMATRRRALRWDWR